MLQRIFKRETRRRTSKHSMVDLEFYDENGRGPFSVANYVQEDLADEIIKALQFYYAAIAAAGPAHLAKRIEELNDEPK